MKKISWGCIVIGTMSIILSFVGVFIPLDNKFVGCNLPFQFLLLLNSLNKNGYLDKFIHLPFFDYLVSIILIISGIGTVWMKSWGRKFAYIYAITIILLSIICMPVGFVIYITKELIRMNKEPSFMDWVIWGGALTYIFTLIGTLLYPTILLIFFSRPEIKEMFGSKI